MSVVIVCHVPDHRAGVSVNDRHLTKSNFVKSTSKFGIFRSFRARQAKFKLQLHLRTTLNVNSNDYNLQTPRFVYNLQSNEFQILQF